MFILQRKNETNNIKNPTYVKPILKDKLKEQSSLFQQRCLKYFTFPRSSLRGPRQRPSKCKCVAADMICVEGRCKDIISWVHQREPPCPPSLRPPLVPSVSLPTLTTTQLHLVLTRLHRYNSEPPVTHIANVDRFILQN